MLLRRRDILTEYLSIREIIYEKAEDRRARSYIQGENNGPVRSYIRGETRERYNYLKNQLHGSHIEIYNKYHGMYLFRGVRQGPFIYLGFHNEYINYFLNNKSKTLD